MERMDDSGQLLVSNDGQHFFNPGTSRNSGKAFSGEHSLKLGMKTEQNISALIPVEPGEQWVVSVKRKSPWFKGVLVLTGDEGAHFYKDIRVGLPSAREGWDSLSLQIEISWEEATTLKVILRNTGRLNAWFDDLRIEKVEKFSP
ncbi:MAG: hypothetical protein RBS53_02580 [Bacteroidales bacterium]|nr:hypothetical protein [Bacteroidales bacterium]NLM92978.1 hypothetical protein [Bacteroidales bacterium]